MSENLLTHETLVTYHCDFCNGRINEIGDNIVYVGTPESERHYHNSSKKPCYNKSLQNEVDKTEKRHAKS